MRNACVLAIVAIISTAGSIAAQTLTAGVKGGIDFASLPNAGEVLDQVVRQPSTESAAKTGVVLSGFVTVPIAGRLGFQPELAYVMKGVKLTEATGGTTTATVRYLEFPLQVRYAAPVGSYTGYVLVGPTFAVKAGTSAAIDTPNLTADQDIDAAIRTFDGGIVFAGGIEYGQWLVEGRYTQGLSDVGSDGFAHADSLRNRVLAVLVGIRFK